MTTLLLLGLAFLQVYSASWGSVTKLDEDDSLSQERNVKKISYCPSTKLSPDPHSTPRTSPFLDRRFKNFKISW